MNVVRYLRCFLLPTPVDCLSSLPGLDEKSYAIKIKYYTDQYYQIYFQRMMSREYSAIYSLSLFKRRSTVATKHYKLMC